MGGASSFAAGGGRFAPFWWLYSFSWTQNGLVLGYHPDACANTPANFASREGYRTLFPCARYRDFIAGW